MPSPLVDQLQRTLGIELHELAGGVVSGEIPLPDAAVNRLIAAQLAARPSPVGRAVVETAAGDRLTIALTLERFRFVPEVRIAAGIEQQPQFPAPAVLSVHWSLPGLGPLALFAGPALAWFKALPPGIRVDGDRLRIDVRALLDARGLGEVADYITRLEIHTRDGALVVQFALRVH